MSFLDMNTALTHTENGSCSTDPGRTPGSGSSGRRREWRCDRRQLWNRERLYLLRRAQDNAARQRQQAQLRGLTDQLLAALSHLEGAPRDARSPATVTPPPHRADAAPAASAPPPPGSGSWLRDQLDLLAELDLIEN